MSNSKIVISIPFGDYCCLQSKDKCDQLGKDYRDRNICILFDVLLHSILDDNLRSGTIEKCEKCVKIVGKKY